VVAGGVSGSLTAALARREERRRRIREEIVRWSNPIFGAVDGLQYRIENILDGLLYPALAPDGDVERPVDSDWSVDHHYALESTLFLFGQYFAWMRLLQQEMRLDLFPSESARQAFFKAVHAVDSALSKWPDDRVVGSGQDAQVFILQQRAIGERLIVRDSGTASVMGYAEFLAARQTDADQTFAGILKPLQVFVTGIAPDSKRWCRLTLAREALQDLTAECGQLLGLNRTR